MRCGHGGKRGKKTRKVKEMLGNPAGLDLPFLLRVGRTTKEKPGSPAESDLPPAWKGNLTLFWVSCCFQEQEVKPFPTEPSVKEPGSLFLFCVASQFRKKRETEKSLPSSDSHHPLYNAAMSVCKLGKPSQWQHICTSPRVSVGTPKLGVKGKVEI